MNPGLLTSGHLPPPLPYGLLGRPTPVPSLQGWQGFNPRAIPDMNLWIDFADRTTITLDANSLIQQINDKSGQGNNATQSTASNRPSLGTLNGLSAGNWGTASNTRGLTRSAGGNTSNWQETAVVAVWDGGGTQFPTYAGLFAGSANAGTASGIGLIGNIDATPGATSWYTNSRWWTSIVQNGTSYTPTSSGALSVVPAFPLITSPFTAQFYSTSAIGVNGLAVGADRTNNRSWRGRIGEVLCWSRQLNESERVAVRLYLCAKWGITP